MSFRDAEASDPNLNGITTVLRAALEQPGYRRNPHQVYDNMDADPLIDALPEAGKPVSRVELLRRVNVNRANPPAIPEDVVHFCREHTQQGPLMPTADTASLGRVQRMESLVDAVASPAGALSLRNTEALVRDVVGAVADPATKLARQKAELTGKNLSRYQVWCYPVTDRQNPLREIGASRAEAINILGLGFYASASEEIVHWGHALPATIGAHRPTAWDAGTSPGNVHWRPGGKTYRLDRDEDGLPEVVHDPIKGEDLIAPIQILI